jgi:uncharacterized protein YceK
MKHKCRLFYFVLLGLFTQGCGTVASHYSTPDHPDPSTGTYRGVKRDSAELVLTWQQLDSGYGLLWEALVACDMPVSAVADTLVWPFEASNSDTKNPQSTPVAHQGD